MVQKLMMLWRDEEAPTAVEYGLMVALVAAVIIVAAGLLGTNVQATFNTVATKIGG
jgi:pilus assembly protein Flp/PilA